MLRLTSFLTFCLAMGCMPPATAGDVDGGSFGSTAAETSTSTEATPTDTRPEAASSSSGGPTCGNGVLDLGETCDGAPVLGTPCPDSCLLPRGTEVWSWTEISRSEDRARRVAVSASGDVFLAGSSLSEKSGPLIIALGADGTERWSLDISDVEAPFTFDEIHAVGDQIFVHGQGRIPNQDGETEVALIRAAYTSGGERVWHSYRLTGNGDYEQHAGPIIDIEDTLYFFSIEERFGAGHSPGVLAASSFQGDFADELLLEAPPINSRVRFGDWTFSLMVASSSPGELYVGGAAFRNYGSDHAMLQRRTTTGELVTSSLYQNPELRTARYSNAVELSDGRVVTVGFRRTPTAVIPLIHLYNPEGERVWELEPNVDKEGSQNVNASVAVLDDQTVVIVGSRERGNSGVDGWLGCVTVETGKLEWESAIQLSPTALWTYLQDIEKLAERVFVIVGYGSDGNSPHDAFARAIAL